MKTCKYCGTQFQDNFCPNCGARYEPQPQPQPRIIYQQVPVQPIPKNKPSFLGIIGLLLALLGFGFKPFSFVALILCIIALCKKNRKYTACAIIGLIFSIISLLFSLGSTYLGYVEKARVDNKVETVEVSENDFKESCIDFDYETIARNPDSYIGQNVKLTVEIFQVSTGKSYDDYDYYYKAFTDDGSGTYFNEMVWLLDFRNTENGYFNILEDDVITVYGTFDGMIETTNAFNGSSGEDIGIKIKYAELVEE